MLIQRIEYQCNYSSRSSTFENSKSSECNTLIEAMKNHCVVEEPVVVYEKRYLSFTTTNDEPLRFRKGPSEDAEIITKLFTGTLGYVTQPGNEWCKVVMTTGREGYLATEFLGMKELTEEEYPEKFRDLVEAPQEDLTELKFIEVSDEQTTDSGSEE